MGLNRLPTRKSRGEGASEMSVRFLDCKLTDVGMAELADAIEAHLADGSPGLNLAQVRDLIGDNLRWLAEGSRIPRLPDLVSTRPTAEERRRRA